ncbi:MAG: type IV secretory system conjugative DNA transfer family protein, partial [Oscillospiraceae bacterium]|nr:type IV secretory system conjugative DNA transfer family protein [Oscillospiraceae bacterium]
TEHGSARWGTRKEKDLISDKADFYNNVIVASDVFLVLDRKRREENEKHGRKKETETNETVKEGDNNDKDMLTVKEVSRNKKKSGKIKPMLNLNLMILGGSGTGKSRFWVKPNLMQCNTSFVVTDPSGELLQSCGKMLELKGYVIKVFNINDMKHSSNYNPFHYLKDFDGNINNNNIIKMINTFMLNTKAEGASTGDQFWDDSTRLLLSALCFLLVETGTEEEQNFANVLDLIHKAKVIEGKEEEKSELDLIMEKHKEDCPDALSVQYYEEFKQAAGKTMQSILISTTTRLQHFKLEDVRNLTFKDNINLETVGDAKTALFIIIPSTDTTYNFLAAMMYSQLFDTLYDRAINHFHGRLPVHVSFICDEFANIGKIPDFDKILATCRKFEISAVVILQSLSQLKRIYEKSWEELPGNCDTLLYLGGQDQFTNEYLVKALGKETIDTLAINKTKSKQGSTSYNDGILGRELATIDELSRMDNNDCIAIVRGMPPFFTPKFDIKNHPRYFMLDEADKENNTFYLEDNVVTDTECVTVDLSQFYDDPDSNGSSGIEIMYLTNDSGVVKTEEEMMSDVPAELRIRFDKLSLYNVG